MYFSWVGAGLSGVSGAGFPEFLPPALIILVTLGVLREPAAQDTFLLCYGLVDTPET